MRPPRGPAPPYDRAGPPRRTSCPLCERAGPPRRGVRPREYGWGLVGRAAREWGSGGGVVGGCWDVAWREYVGGGVGLGNRQLQKVRLGLHWLCPPMYTRFHF